VLPIYRAQSSPRRHREPSAPVSVIELPVNGPSPIS
jgi:hypothetical protein